MKKRGESMEIKREVISAREAAQILGVAPEKVRQRIKLGIWKFGERIPKEKTGNKQDTYCVYARKLYEHIGKGGEED